MTTLITITCYSASLVMEKMPLDYITVKVPATSANMGPGFDVFALALEKPSDKVTLLRKPSGIKIEVTGILAETISTVPEENSAGIVAKQILKKYDLSTGVLVRIEKGIIPGRGLGSSAASAAAVAYGMNRMFDLDLCREKLVWLAAKGEVASAGSAHADNVSAAICGGFVIIRSYDPLEIVCLDAPENMQLCVAVPELNVPVSKTKKARSVVPKHIPMEKHVWNLGKAAAIAAGFVLGDVDLIGKSMCDAIVEPARAFLIPGYIQVKEKAFEAGACGVTISGAGPAMLAVVNSKRADTQKVADAMHEGFKSAGVRAEVFTTRPGKGATVLEERH
jgi:homoserine kinase